MQRITGFITVTRCDIRSLLMWGCLRIIQKLWAPRDQCHTGVDILPTLPLFSAMRRVLPSGWNPWDQASLKAFRETRQRREVKNRYYTWFHPKDRIIQTNNNNSKMKTINVLCEIPSNEDYSDRQTPENRMVQWPKRWDSKNKDEIRL